MANPKKLTQKQEAFAQAFVLGIDGDASTANNASAAYRHAYSTKNMSADSVRVEANKLENHPNISLRISELQEAKKKKAEKRNETTIDLIDGMHKAAFKIAKQEGQASAMTSAAKNLSELHGLARKEPAAPAASITVNLPDGYKPN